MDSSLLFIFIGLILLSALFSGAETAFLTSQKAKILVWRRQKKWFSKILYFYVLNPEKFLISTLVGNNTVNVLYTTIGTILFIPFIHDENLVALLLSLIILIFSEISPKIYFSLSSDRYIRTFALLIRINDILLYPVTKIAGYISSLSLKSVSINKREVQSIFSVDDIHEIFKETFDEPHNESQTLAYVKNILLLKNTRVREVLIPRMDMIFLHKNNTIEEVRDIFDNGKYTRLPVIDESIDKIIGYIHVRELLQNPSKITDIIHEVLFIPENKSCYELLKELRLYKKSFAIVIDEFGGTSGIVFIENILSIIVGEIKLEDSDVKMYNTIIPLNNSVYKISGRALKEDVERLGINLSNGSYETIAGFLLEHIKRIPSKGEVFEFDSFNIKVLSATLNRIQWILLELNND